MISASGFAYTLRILLSEGVCRIAVPAFFLISGYLFFANMKEWDGNVWIGKLKRRVHTLLIPYIIWNILGIAYVCLSPYVGAVTETPDSLLSIIQERGWLRLFWDSNRVMEQWSPPDINMLGVTMHHGMPANTPLWFIRDLIIINILSPFIYLLVKHTKFYFIGALCILFILNIWFPFEGLSIIGVLFYSLGSYYALLSKGLLEHFSKIKYLSLIGSSILLILLTVLWGRHWSAQYIQRLFVLFGVVAAFNLASIVMRNGNGLMSRISDSSFFIYASHIMIISAIAFILGRLIPGSNQVIMAIRYLLTAFITILICEGAYQVLKSFSPNIVSFLCGSRVKRK